MNNDDSAKGCGCLLLVAAAILFVLLLTGVLGDMFSGLDPGPKSIIP